MNTAVLGAGIAGLAYMAHAQGEQEDHITIYEKNSRPGGLCMTMERDGFLFDLGPHMSFTADQTVRALFDQSRYRTMPPEPVSYYKGKYVKHPVSHNLYGLDVAERCECLESFLDRDTDRKICNYADWLSCSYGTVMKERFYDVYTRKYWRMESEKLSASWMGPRFVHTDRHQVLYGAMTDNTGNGMYMQELRYPVQGGFETFLNPLKEPDQTVYKSIRYKKEVKSIDADRKVLFFSDGTTASYDRLVSSLPLNRMPYIIQNAPAQVKAAADRLRYTKISMVTVAFGIPDAARYLSLYVYDEDILAARIHSPGLMSENNVPKGCSSYQFEIYHLDTETPDPEKIMENVRYSIQQMQIAALNKVIFMDYRPVPYAQVVFYNGMEEDRKIVLDYLHMLGIESVGRFGAWEYYWSDQSYASGKNAAVRNRRKEKG